MKVTKKAMKRTRDEEAPSDRVPIRRVSPFPPAPRSCSLLRAFPSPIPARLAGHRRSSLFGCLAFSSRVCACVCCAHSSNVKLDDPVGRPNFYFHIKLFRSFVVFLCVFRCCLACIDVLALIGSRRRLRSCDVAATSGTTGHAPRQWQRREMCVCDVSLDG